MRTISLHVCLFLAASAIWAQRTPKAPETGHDQRIAPIEAENIVQIKPETVPAYETALDGTSYTILRIRKTGAPALRIRFTDVRVAEDGALLVYGSDASRPWAYDARSEAAAVVNGEVATIEWQCGVQCPADVPFTISDVEAIAAAVAEDVAAPGERGVANFRGVDVEYEVRDGLAVAEGDMILGPVHELQSPRGTKGAAKEAVGMSSDRYRWPDGRIPYVIDDSISNRDRVLDAIAHWNSNLAGVISLVPRRSSDDVYVTFVGSGSCSATIGMYTYGNTVRLASNCSVGNTIHEIGHVVGLFHEHTREDRNSHVRIRTENVSSSAIGNFAQALSISSDIGNYDFNSIMHYSAYAFSSNGRATIETIPAGIPIGQRNGLSSGDIAAVRRMYGYSSAPYTPPPPAPTPTPTPKPTPPPDPDPTPTTIAVTISANPSTETIIVDGESYTGSVRLTWRLGSVHTLSAGSRDDDDDDEDTIRRFVRWSNGGARSHTVTASTGTTSYRADFAVNHKVIVRSNSSARGSVSLTPASSSGYYAANADLTLKATPEEGYCFAGWSGLISGTPAVTDLSVTKPYEITANFATGIVSLPSHVDYVKKTGDTASVAITSSSGCPWEARSHVSWVRIHAPSRGTGSATLTYTVEPNTTGVIRAGLLTIGGRDYWISQSGLW